MGLIPEFKLLANGSDITGTIQKRLSSLTFTDEAGMESDRLTIVLDDSDPTNPIQLPPDGAELELYQGYDGAAQRMGLFITDEITLSGWPGVMTITAHAAPFDKSKGGKSDLQTQKTRSWPKDTTLGSLVNKIAVEHGMQGAVSSSLASIVLPHLDQSDESDMHFLLRIARKYDALVKPAGGKLVLSKRGDGTSAGGSPLPAVTIAAADVSSYSVTLSKREQSGSVVAAYHDTKTAKRQVVTVGDGEPVTRLRMQHATKDMATAAAKAEMDKRDRAKATVEVTLAGQPGLAAEAPMTLSGFRAGVDGKWMITSVEHRLDNETGYSCSVRGETPNSGAARPVKVTAE